MSSYDDARASRLDTGSAPNDLRFSGDTQITVRGMALMYAAVKNDPVV